MTSVADPGQDAAAESPRLHPLSQGFVWQDAPGVGMRRLSADQIDAFNKQGFFIYRDAFTPGEIAAVTAAIDPLEQENVDYVESRGGWRGLTRNGAISFTAHIVSRSRVLTEFARHRVIKDICHDIIGGDVRLYWDQSVYKKTEKPQEFPWHQDNGYTFIEPQQYLTLWIPLVDVDEENGCPWIAPGLHKLGTLEHWTTNIGRVCLTSADAVSAPARVGDIVVFSSLAPHRTGPNVKAGTVRKVYILQYAPEGAHTRLPDGQVLAQSDPVRQFKILENGR